MTTTPQTATVSDEAVQVAIKSFEDTSNNCETYQDMRKAITAALPHLALSPAPCCVEVEKLDWTHQGGYDVWNCIQDENLDIVRWYFDGARIEVGHFKIEGLSNQRFGTIEEAKAAAQADFDRRILSAIVTKPVDVAAVRKGSAIAENALQWIVDHPRESNAAVWDVAHDALSAIRALSPAEPAQQWQPIETALDQFWRSISEADKTITFDQVLDPEGVNMHIRMSDNYWVRDTYGRVYEASWTDHKDGYWWDIEQEEPCEPVEFMPHPLSAAPLSAGRTTEGGEA